MCCARKMSGRRPVARSYHAAFGIDQTMLAWGGKDGGRHVTATVDSFDVQSLTWKEQRQLRGDPLPCGLANVAVASDGRKAYLFGGVSLKGYEDKAFSVDLRTLECRELLQGSYVRPRGREHSRMVFCGGRLVAYGGLSARGVSNILYVFDFGSGV